MPTYEFKCDKCGKVFERILPIAQRNDHQDCDCGSPETHRIMSLTNFNLVGDGWPGKAGRVNNQMRKKNERLDRKQAERMRDDTSIPQLAPNVGGVRTDTWAEAKKLAVSEGKSAKSYEPYVRKETERSKS